MGRLGEVEMGSEGEGETGVWGERRECMSDRIKIPALGTSLSSPGYKR